MASAAHSPGVGGLAEDVAARTGMSRIAAENPQIKLELVQLQKADAGLHQELSDVAPKLGGMEKSILALHDELREETVQRNEDTGQLQVVVNTLQRKLDKSQALKTKTTTLVMLIIVLLF